MALIWGCRRERPRWLQRLATPALHRYANWERQRRARDDLPPPEGVYPAPREALDPALRRSMAMVAKIPSSDVARSLADYSTLRVDDSGLPPPDKLERVATVGGSGPRIEWLDLTTLDPAAEVA